MAAPAVEAAPIGALLGASLLALCAYVALVGLSKGYDYSLGALLRTLASVLDFRVWKFSVKLGGAFDALDHRIRDSIAAGIQGLEYTIGRLFHGVEYLVRLQWDALAGFAGDVEAAIRGIVLGEIPQQITANTRGIGKRISAAEQYAAARLNGLGAKVYHGIDALRRDLTHEALLSRRGIDALAREITQVVIPGVRALDREIADVWGYTRRNLARRLTHVEQLVLGGAIVGTALAVLTRYFPYWQCTNVRGFNRVLCRAPVGAPQELFALLLAAGAIGNLRQLVRLAQGVADETTGGIGALLRAKG